MPRGGSLRTPRWSEEEEALLYKLRQEGLKENEIGHRLGRSRSAINAKLRYQPSDSPRNERGARGGQPGVRYDARSYKRSDLNSPQDHREETEWHKKCAKANEAFCNAMAAAGHPYGVAKPEPYTPTARRYTPVSMPLTKSQLGD